MRLDIFQFYYVSSAESGEHNKKYESKCEICSNSFIKCNIKREIHSIIKRRAMNNIKKSIKKDAHVHHKSFCSQWQKSTTFQIKLSKKITNHFQMFSNILVFEYYRNIEPRNFFLSRAICNTLF